MKSIIVRILSYSLGLYLTAQLVQGLYYDTVGALIFGAIVLAIVDSIVKPVVMLLTLPINLMTIGLFTFVVNGLMLKITAMIVPGLDVGGFFVTVFAALVLTGISTIISWIISD